MRMFRLLASLAAMLLIAAPAVPASADPIVVDDEHCVINVRTDDRLNVREGPGTRYDVVARWRYAQCGIFVSDSCRGSWCPVEDGHFAGWVHRHYIAAVSPSLYCVTGVGRGDVLNVRAYPSPSSRIITTLGRRQCDIAFLPYAVGSWQKIRVDGWEGWVNRRYLSGQ